MALHTTSRPAATFVSSFPFHAAGVATRGTAVVAVARAITSHVPSAKSPARQPATSTATPAVLPHAEASTAGATTVTASTAASLATAATAARVTSTLATTTHAAAAKSPAFGTDAFQRYRNAVSEHVHCIEPQLDVDHIRDHPSQHVRANQ